MTMTTRAAPIALTIGEPAGVGPDLVPLAWDALRRELDFVLLGDPTHLPPGTVFECVDSMAEAARVMPRALPVLPMDFGPPRQPGQAVAAHAPTWLRPLPARWRWCRQARRRRSAPRPFTRRR